MKNKLFYTVFIIFALMIAFLCFFNLDYEMVQHWDEARHGVNTYEMVEEGNIIVHTYDGETDYWNLKPVLSFWGLGVFFKLFGASVTTLRLYSSVCVFVMAIICGIFLYRKYGKKASILFMAMFSACTPFWFAPLPEDFSTHFARSGDSDGLFLLMFTLSMLFLSKTGQGVKNLYLAGFFHALAFLTKSWHGTIALIIIVLYLILTKERKLSIKEKLMFLLCSEGPVLLWAVIRTIVDGPRFILTMLGYDLGARIAMPIEGHTGGILYYLQFIFAQPSFAVIMILGLIGLVTVIIREKGFKISNTRIFYMLWCLLPILLFTVAGTKIWWYIYPSVIGLLCCISVLLSKLTDKIKFQKTLCAVLSVCMLGFFAYNVYELKDLRTGDFQQFVSDLDTDFNGKPVYSVHNSTSPGWGQGNFFVGTIKGLNCREGGYDTFITSDEKAVLLLEKSFYNALKSYDNRFKNTEIVYESEKFIAIQRR